MNEEKIKEIIMDFDDWVWCDCNDCRTDPHSHAVNTEASKAKLIEYILKELKMNKEAEDLLKKYETCYAYNTSFKFYYKKSMPRHECEVFVADRNQCKGGHWEVRRKIDYQDHYQLLVDYHWAGDGS